MDAVGGDGFLMMDPDFTRRYIRIADDLTPALQKLDVVRKNTRMPCCATTCARSEA
jgi:hypothetical protein